MKNLIDLPRNSYCHCRNGRDCWFFAIAGKNIETFCAVSFWRNGKAKLEKLVLLGNQQSQPEPDICVIASLGSRLVGFDSGAWLICKP